MKQRNALLTTNAVVSVVLVAALLVAINYLGSQHHVRWDLTATREHSLSPQTIKVLRTLPGPIDVVAFPDPDSAAEYRRMLSTYQYYSKDFQYRIVDPVRTPEEFQRYKLTSIGQIVLQRGKASYTVDSDTEEQLTNGILHLLETTKKVLYELQGEGEPGIDDFSRGGVGTARQALVNKGFDVKPLPLVQTNQVPDDAAALLIIGPTKDLQAHERDAIEHYYQNGGKLFMTVDPQTPAGVRAWLGSALHVDAPGGLVIDPLARLFQQSPAVPIITQYPPSDITQNFTLATAFPLSTPLEPQPKAAGVMITPVVRSSDASYVKVNLESRDVRFEPGVDRKGPAILAAQVTPAPVPAPAKPAAGKAPAAPTPVPPKGSAVIFGTTGFIQNSAIAFAGNQDLFVSAVAWLTQSGNLVSIAPRTSPFDAFIIGGSQGRLLFLGSVIVIPLALLAVGASVSYWRRRL